MSVSRKIFYEVDLFEKRIAYSTKEANRLTSSSISVKKCCNYCVQSTRKFESWTIEFFIDVGYMLPNYKLFRNDNGYLLLPAIHTERGWKLKKKYFYYKI